MSILAVNHSEMNPSSSNMASSSNSASRKRKADSSPALIASVVDGEQNSRYATYVLNQIKTRMVDRPNQQLRFPFIHDVTMYDKILKIGQGTFGEVFKARCKRSKKFVALKKILMEREREGFPITAIREVKMLQRLKNEYITDLIEICNTKSTAANEKSTFYLVFTFCDYDLAGLLSELKVRLAIEDIKCMMKHILEGLYKIHSSGILHRDMKTANILISPEGVLKLADFGLSRQTIKSGKPVNYTNCVVTLWYRPPELLLGSRRYGPPIDIWGLGCIMAELWTKTPILQGDTEQRQLELIQNMCGGINNKNVWPGVDQLPYFKRLVLKPDQPRILRNKMREFVRNEDALNLLDQLLTLDPEKRIDANRALEDDFFFVQPLPRDNIKHVIENLPKNIFEFTAGRGAHANRRPQHPQNNQVRPIANASHHPPPTNGVDRQNRSYVTAQDSQLKDMIY